MTMEMKYVIVNVAFADLCPIVFREDLGHEIAALGLNPECRDSAGFVSVVVDPDSPARLKATAYGRSQGLGLAAKVERDSRILTRFFNRGVEVDAQDSQPK
jgi:hypothetical protein